MTVDDLALHLITHSADEPSCISFEQAEHIISMLDRNEPLPSDLTPVSLRNAWNTLILFDLPDDVWQTWRK